MVKASAKGNIAPCLPGHQRGLWLDPAIRLWWCPDCGGEMFIDVGRGNQKRLEGYPREAGKALNHIHSFYCCRDCHWTGPTSATATAHELEAEHSTYLEPNPR